MDEKKVESNLCDLRLELQMLKSWLGSELGYDRETQGRVSEQIGENTSRVSDLHADLRGDGEETGLFGRVNQVELTLKEVAVLSHEMADTLRGTGKELGIVGQVAIMWRSWVFVVGLLGAGVGFAVRGWL